MGTKLMIRTLSSEESVFEFEEYLRVNGLDGDEADDDEYGEDEIVLMFRALVKAFPRYELNFEFDAEYGDCSAIIIEPALGVQIAPVDDWRKSKASVMQHLTDLDLNSSN